MKLSKKHKAEIGSIRYEKVDCCEDPSNRKLLAEMALSTDFDGITASITIEVCVGCRALYLRDIKETK